MLARLATGEATVSELAEPFTVTFAAISKHLGVLESAGLVSRGRDAKYRPARLDARPLAVASGWIGDYAQFWGDSLGSLETLLTRLQAPTHTTNANTDTAKNNTTPTPHTESNEP
jgi:Bacterial regulatory protein, arsR family